MGIKRDIITEFRNIHGDKYVYFFDEYINNKQRIKIECKNGHQFEMDVLSHLKGYGCQYCSGRKKSKLDIIKKLNEVHQNFYDYSKVEWVKKTDKVIIICPEHGEFTQELRVHEKGHKCPKCSDRYVKSDNDFIGVLKNSNPDIIFSLTKYVNKNTKSTFICKRHGVIERYPHSIRNSNNIICLKCLYEKEGRDNFIRKSINKYGNRYDYSLVEYVDNITPVKIIDTKSKRIFEQRPGGHLKSIPHNLYWSEKVNTDKFIQQAGIVHNKIYNYDESIYIGSKKNLKIKCDLHGPFEQTPNNHLKGTGCPKCNRFNLKQDSVFNFIKNDLDISNVILNDRQVLGSKELDIFLPDFNLAIEFNGLYWHSEVYLEKNYHQNKSRDCLSKNINLLHIWEDDWDKKEEICKSIIRNKLNKIDNRIFARKCEIREISNIEGKNFLEENHIQGYIRSKLSIGLFYQNELVSLMTFGDFRVSLGQRKEFGSYEMLRFCNKINTNVVGGASKLFNYFIKKYNPIKIVSYSDNSRYNGNLYSNLGFNFIHNSPPNYYYIINGVRKNRYGFTKHKLVSKGYDKNKTEHQIMLDNKYYRIYDCGSKKWEYKNKTYINE